MKNNKNKTQQILRQLQKKLMAEKLIKEISEVNKMANDEQLQKKYNDEIVKKTWDYQKKFDFETSNRQGHEFWNNEADAFKHAFGSADMYFKYGNWGSTLAGINHENKTPNNPTGEWNMDSWNNAQGRQIAKEIKSEYGSDFYKLSQKEQDAVIASKIMVKMRNGELITNPADKRKFEGQPENVIHDIRNIINGKPTGGAANIRDFAPPYTREDIKNMTPEEFSYYEKSIMDEMKNGRIIDENPYGSQSTPPINPNPNIKIYTREDIRKMTPEEYAKNEKAILKQLKTHGIPQKSSRSSNSSGKSSDSNDGHWVTINGNHVLIND